MKKTLSSLLALLLVAVLLAGCGAQPSTSGGGQSTAPQDSGAQGPTAQNTAQPGQKVKDTLTFGIHANPQTFDPTDVVIDTDMRIQNAIFDRLVLPGATQGEFLPALAESWDVQADGTILFTLRDDVYFHNGEKLTAEDVVFSMQRSCTSAGNKSMFVAFDPDNIVAKDERTVSMGFKYPNVAAFAYLAGPRGNIVCKKAVEEMGEDAVKMNPVGTGSYEFVSYTSGDRVVLKRNENYWGETAQTENLVFRIIPEDTVRAMEVEAGGIDIALKVAPIDMDRLKDNPNLNAVAEVGYAHIALLMNSESDVWQDIRVRQAMFYAIDVASIVKAVYGDYAVPCSGMFSNQVAYFKDLGVIERDLEKAKQLLAEAGLPDGFAVQVAIPQESDTLAILEIAQAQWAEAGIQVEIVVMESVALRELNAKGGNSFGRSNYLTSTGDPDHALLPWGSSWSGIMHIRDPHIDELMAKGLAAFDSTERGKVYAELQQYIHDLYYMLMIACPKELAVTTNEVQNFDMTQPYINNFNEIFAYAK